MALIRHIAGIPTATEQRCVRCCEVIGATDHKLGNGPFWPGGRVILGGPAPAVVFDNTNATDCTPHDPHAIDDLREVLGEALAEMERAR